MHAGTGVVGVAEDIGGCCSKGVDASAFRSPAAGGSCTTSSKSWWLCRRERTSAHTTRVLEGTVASRTRAVIFSLAGRTLRWVYIGDNGFVVFRDSKLMHRSRAQQHYFNCPYQLDVAGNGVSISHTTVGEIPAMEGDMVVVGT
jgi:protein phosphatase PTC7